MTSIIAEATGNANLNTSDEIENNLPLISHHNPTTQLLLANKVVTHTNETGLNPLVDSAAQLFSIIGKLKHVKNHNLPKLHAELVKEIESFQEQMQGHKEYANQVSEYMYISCYALALTLDDIISNMPWGNQGKWEEYSLVVTFNQHELSRKSFFVILERLIRDPAIYIDIIEFMYICLSLGFKCQYNNNASTFDHEQLEQIIDSLYKRIRAQRGNFSKTLAPFPIKFTKAPEAAPNRHISLWIALLLVTSLTIFFLISGQDLINRYMEYLYFWNIY